MKRYLLQLLILFLAGSVASQPVPFDPGRGLVEIEVTINGYISGTFGIDTGADLLYLDRDFAQEHGLRMTEGSGRMFVSGVGGDSKISHLDIRSLKLSERETLYNLEALAVDMKTLGGLTKGEPPDGLIGFDILRRFYIYIDGPGKEIELISHEPDLPDFEQRVGTDFNQHGHLILKRVELDEEVFADMIVDFCATRTTISPRLAEELGYDADTSQQITLKWLDIDPKIGQSEVRVIIMDHSNLRKSMPDVEFDGIIGADYLRKYRVIVDYKRSVIWFD